MHTINKNQETDHEYKKQRDTHLKLLHFIRQIGKVTDQSKNAGNFIQELQQITNVQLNPNLAQVLIQKHKRNSHSAR